MDLEINNEVGSATLPDKAKKISDSECAELCSLMSALMTKVKETNVNTATTAFGLEGSFVQDGLGAEDTREMVETWVDFEDDPLVKEAELEELIEDIDLEESGVGEEHVEEEDDPTVAVEDEEPIPTKIECEAMITKLLLFSREIWMSEVANHNLMKFQREMHSICMKKNARAFQTSMCMFFATQPPAAKKQKQNSENENDSDSESSVECVSTVAPIHEGKPPGDEED